MSVRKYENGLTVIVDTVQSLRSVTAGIMVGTGSAYETAENNGISHFIEHMLFKGTSRRSAADIVRGFDNAGANYNAFTGKEYTCFYFKSIDEKTEDCFDILSDLFLNSTFEKDELDRERKVILEEIGMSKDEPDGVCYDILARVMYRGSLGMEILGNADNVSRFEKPDIDLYRGKHYTPADTVVAFVGNITENAACALVDKYLADLIAAPKCERSEFAFQPFNGGYAEYIHDYEQSELSVAYPNVVFGDERAARSAVLDCILGNSMSSRLFQRIREKMGLCYSVYTQPRLGGKTGVFSINANVNAKNAVKCLEAIKDEITNLVKNGATDEEVSRAKMQLKVGSLFGKENQMNYMLQLMRWRVIRDEDYDIDRTIAQVEAVDRDSVTEFAREMFSSPTAIAYVGKDPCAKLDEIYEKA